MDLVLEICARGVYGGLARDTNSRYLYVLALLAYGHRGRFVKWNLISWKRISRSNDTFTLPKFNLVA
jgi:hypothetical protein